MRDWRRAARSGGAAGDSAPLHASDAQARDFPRAAAGQGTPEAVEEADADQELAAASGADGALALMALALARPSLYREAPLGSESQPTALGLVFDTSLSMGYIEKDKTRLDEAKERAREIVSKLPDSSLVFVVDSAEPPVPVGPIALAGAQAHRRADHPADQPAAQRRDGPGLSGGRRVRPPAARRLRADRPCPARHGIPNGLAEGLDQVEKLKKSKGSQDRHVHPGRGRDGGNQRLGRTGRAIVERGHPGRPDRDSRPDPLSGHQADDSRRRIRGRRQEEGRENARDSARRRGRGQFHRAAASRRDQLAPGQDQAERRARPLRGGRRAVLHLQGAAAAQGALGLRRSLSRPSSSRLRSTRTRRPLHAPGSGRESSRRRARHSLRRQIFSGSLPSSCST